MEIAVRLPNRSTLTHVAWAAIRNRVGL